MFDVTPQGTHILIIWGMVVILCSGASLLTWDAVSSYDARIGHDSWKWVVPLYIVGWIVLWSLHAYAERSVVYYYRLSGSEASIPWEVRWFANSMEIIANAGYHFFFFMWYMLKRERNEQLFKRLKDDQAILYARMDTVIQAAEQGVEESKWLRGIATSNAKLIAETAQLQRTLVSGVEEKKG